MSFTLRCHGNEYDDLPILFHFSSMWHSSCSMQIFNKITMSAQLVIVPFKVLFVFLGSVHITDRRGNNGIAMSNNDEWRQVVADSVVEHTLLAYEWGIKSSIQNKSNGSVSRKRYRHKSMPFFVSLYVWLVWCTVYDTSVRQHLDLTLWPPSCSGQISGHKSTYIKVWRCTLV